MILDAFRLMPDDCVLPPPDGQAQDAGKPAEHSQTNEALNHGN